MTLYGAAAASVVWWTMWPAPLQLGAWLLVVAGLTIAVLLQLQRVRSHFPRASGRRPFDRGLARRIGLVILAYSVAECVAAVVLHLLDHDALIFPIAVAIAGIHFFVFARVLETWQYYVTGVLDCVAALASVVFVSQASTVGLLSAWIFFPLAGGGVALFVTAGLMLYESRAISFEGQKAVSRT